MSSRHHVINAIVLAGYVSGWSPVAVHGASSRSVEPGSEVPATLGWPATMTLVPGPRIRRYQWGDAGIEGVTNGAEGAVSQFSAAAPAEIEAPVESGSGAEGAYQIQTPENEASALVGGTATGQVTTSDGGLHGYVFDECGLLKSYTVTGPDSGSSQTTFDYEERLPVGATYPGGEETAYTYASDSAAIRSRGNVERIRRTPAGGGNAIEKTFTYDAFYNLPLTENDFDGRAITYAVEPGARRYVTGIDYGSGSTAASATFFVNDHGQPTRQVSPDGTVQTWDYAPATGFLERVTEGEPEADGTVEVTYGYAGSELAAKLGLPTTVTPGEASRLAETLEYDEWGRLVHRRRGAQHEELGYDLYGRPRQVTTQVEASRQRVETYAYDDYGFLERRTIEGVEVDGSPSTLTWQYAPNARRTGFEDIQASDGRRVHFGYDAQQRRTSSSVGATDPITETYAYDDTERTVTVTRGSHAEVHRYDGLGRRSRIEYPDGSRAQFAYTGEGFIEVAEVLASATGPALSRVTTTSHDALGRPLAWSEADGVATYQASYAGVVQTVTQSPSQVVTTQRRYTSGLAESTETPGLASVSSTYFGDGRLETVTQLESGTDYGGGYAYNNLGQLLEARDATGAALVSYAPRLEDGQPLETRVDPGTESVWSQMSYSLLGEELTSTDGAGVTRERTYDGQRNLSFEGLNAYQNQGRAYDYDEAGRLVSVSYRDGGSETFSSFNDFGLPEASSFSGGGSRTFGYDGRGRRTSETHVFGAFSDAYVHTYDGLGRLEASTSGGSPATSYGYDLFGVQTSFTLHSAGTSFNKTVDRSDSYGLPLEVTYPDGETVTAGRTVHGRLSSMGTASSTTSLISSVTYQSAELMADVRLGSGLVRSDVYDHRKRLLQRTYTSSSGRTISELRYAYDGANRETARQYVERAGQTDLFTYDAASRLSRAELKARPASPLSEDGTPLWAVSAEVPGDWRPGQYGRDYGFDAAGRDELVTVTTDPFGASPAPFAASRSYDGVGRLDGVDGFSPTYDALGNVTRARLASPYGDATLAYDGLSRLRTVTFDDGTVVEYGYRPDGLPVERELTCGTSAPVTCADVHQVFVYDGLRLLEVYDVVSGTPEPSARYYYADEGEVPFAGDFDLSGTGTLERHNLVVDRQGSITGVLDANNAWVERVSYDAYGRPLIEPSDAMAPEVSLLIDAGTSLEVAFSEDVFPAVAPASGDLVGVLGLAGAVEVRDSTGALVSDSDVTYLDDLVHGNGRNTTVRVPLSSGLADGTYTLTVVPGFLTDDWGNEAGGSVSFSVSSGNVVFTGTSFGATDAGAVETSAVGNVLFFQSHLWDADAGLLHMKSRVLDPSTGHFLQRDPVAYRDALNLYAGYAWDPVNLRDPTGQETSVGRMHRRNEEAYLRGEISAQELKDRRLAIGVGGAVGGTAVLAVMAAFEAPVVIGAYAGVTSSTYVAVESGLDAVEASVAGSGCLLYGDPAACSAASLALMDLVSGPSFVGDSASGAYWGSRAVRGELVEFRDPFTGQIRTARASRFGGSGGRRVDPGTAARGTGSAANRALHERYVDGLRAAMERPHVQDAGLSRIVDTLYRPGARVGSGSTAAAVRHEMATGARVGGRLHTRKARESVTRLQRWLNGNPTARPGDRAAAENILRDLQNALGGY